MAKDKNLSLISIWLEQRTKSIVASLQTTIPMMLQKLTLTTYSLVFSNYKKSLLIKHVLTTNKHLLSKKF